MKDEQSDELTKIIESIKTAIKDAYAEGFEDGSIKQALLEIQGRDRFLDELRASTPVVKPDTTVNDDYIGALISQIRGAFFHQLEAKTGWGRNEIKALFESAIDSAI